MNLLSTVAEKRYSRFEMITTIIAVTLIHVHSIWWVLLGIPIAIISVILERAVSMRLQVY